MTENLNAERYVAGTLSDEEVARFEEAMIERPDLAADVNVRRRIKAGLAQLEQNNELEALLAPEPRRTHHFRYAAAAAVLVIVAAGLFTIWNREAAAPLQAMFNASELGGRQVASSFMLANTRSADVPFDLQRNAGPVHFRILVDDPAAAPFQVNLTAGRGSDSRSIDETSISQAADGFAEIYLDPRELESGDYALTLTSKTGVAQRFPFELRINP